MEFYLLLLAFLLCINSQPCNPPWLVRFNGHCDLCDYYIPGCLKCVDNNGPLAQCATSCSVEAGFKPDVIRVPGQADKCQCQTWDVEEDRYGSLWKIHGGCYPCRYYSPGCLLGLHGYYANPAVYPPKYEECDEERGFFLPMEEGFYFQKKCQCVSPSAYIKIFADYDECLECRDVMPGCIKCTNESICITCSAAQNFKAAPNAQGKCDCETNHVLNTTSGICEITAVIHCIDGCLSCPEDWICSEDGCDYANGWESHPEEGCSCRLNYVRLGNRCAHCTELFNGCQDCNLTKCYYCDFARLGFMFHNEMTKDYCVCSPAHYPVPKDNPPFPGAINCLPCNSTLSFCLECQSATNCTKCSSGYAVDATSKCSACSTQMPGCLNCTSMTNCTRCSTPNRFTLVESGVCQCIDLYYYNSASNACVRCPSQCLKCSSATNCSLCVDTHLLSASNVCQLCSVSIVGCTRCLSTTQCIECDTANGFTYSNFQCFCPVRQYVDNVAKACKNCSDTSLTNCVFCTSATFCTGCSSNSYVLSQISGTEQVCRPCSTVLPGCLQCSSNQVCLSCNESQNYRLLANKTCGCANTHFLTLAGECSSCSDILVGCLRCTDSATCTVCDGNRNYALNVVTNTCGCKREYYLNATNECQKINSILGCQTYQNESVCSGCGPNFVNFRDRCQCRDGYYLQVASYSCKKCTDPNCAVCISQTQCKVCDAFFTLITNESGATCRSCGPYCPTCNATHCLGCLSYSNNFFNKSLCECNIDAYPVPSLNKCMSCRKAMYGCRRCTGPNTCIECEWNLQLYNNSCPLCKPGYWRPVGVLAKCDNCSANCATCYGANDNCTSCPGTQHNKLFQGRCLCFGFYRYNIYGQNPGFYSACFEKKQSEFYMFYLIQATFRLDREWTGMTSKTER